MSKNSNKLSFGFAAQPTKYLQVVYALLWSAALITGCANKYTLPQNEIPDIGFRFDEMNTQIEITAPIGYNTFKMGDPVGLEVKVISENSLAFRHDYGTKIFVYNNNEWKEIENSTNYPEGWITLSPSKANPNSFGTAVLLPKLSNLDQPVELRVIIVGYVYDNDQITNKRTAGFIDIEMRP